MLSSAWIAFAVCCAVVVGLTVFGIYFSRKRKKKGEPDGPGPVKIVREVPDNIPDRSEDSTGVVFPGKYPPIQERKSHELDLDRAISTAVYRAILKGDAELELTVKLPEKCRLFGHEVDADGTVKIRTFPNDTVEYAGFSNDDGDDEEAPLF